MWGFFEGFFQTQKDHKVYSKKIGDPYNLFLNSPIFLSVRIVREINLPSLSQT